MHVDVVFPLRLPPLTYKVTDNAPIDLIGRVVKAPLSGKSRYGIIVSVSDLPAAGNEKNILEIESIHNCFASEVTVSLLKWLSDYYLSPIGIAMKSSFFEEAVNIVVSGQCPVVSKETKSLEEKKYRAFLCHAPSISHEYSLLNELLNKSFSEINGAIIIVPEIAYLGKIEPMIRDIFGERLCILHSNLTKKRRIDAITRIISCQSDVILGTRSAILAPIGNVSFISVLSEHSTSYKGEEGLRYNARDVAVMRGYLEKSCVLLSSICPSMESVYNEKTGKYTALRNSRQPDTKRPKIKIIDASRLQDKALTISGDITEEARNVLSKKGKFLFLINRKGYSLVKCADCGHTLRCEKCGIPVVFYKSKNSARCRYCGLQQNVPESCGECKGFSLKPVGAGTEKIREDIEKLLGIKPLLLEKGSSVSTPILPTVYDIMPFVVGTAYAAKKLRDEQFDAAAFFNTDSLISQPDFRACERVFQEVIQTAEMVKPEGHLFLQTRHPRDKILRLIRNYDFHEFYDYEMSQRKIINYPPFSRIILFNISAKENVLKSLYEVQKRVENTVTRGLEILGPVEISSPIKPHKHCIQVLMKSVNRKILHTAARELLQSLGQLKGIKINVDVDPLRI